MATVAAAEPQKGVRVARADMINVLLIVLACVSTHAFPWRTLILAYAVLGPGHYLTEISWLHDRQYFVRGRWFLPLTITLTGLLTVAAFVRGASVPWLACGLLLTSLFAALAAVGGWKRAALAVAVGGSLLASASNQLPAIALAIAILLPTVVHIFVFTAAFMAQGARRSGSAAGYLTGGLFILTAASFVGPFGSIGHAGAEGVGTATTYFQPIVDELRRLGFTSNSADHAVGFLGFAYAYHYLNWFSKVEIIRWHKMPPIRLVMMVYLCGAILVTYWINFALGFMVSLMLSNLHVLLEFPLDIRVLAGLPVRPVQNGALSSPSEGRDGEGR